MVNVLYEDHHLIAVNKPAPLLTQAPPGVPSLEAMVKAYIKEKYNKPAGVYLGVPHRLDRPVTGVVLFCRNTKAAQRVHAQFQNRTVVKVYKAILHGELVSPANERGHSAFEWTDWIRKLPDEARVEKANEGELGAKYAKLICQIDDVSDGLTYVTLKPETGRSHQLRVQCAWRGHPIRGDGQYGSLLPSTDRIDLHAASLTIEHPFTKEQLTFEAKAPWKS